MTPGSSRQHYDCKDRKPGNLVRGNDVSRCCWAPVPIGMAACIIIVYCPFSGSSNELVLVGAASNMPDRVSRLFVVWISIRDGISSLYTSGTRQLGSDLDTWASARGLWNRAMSSRPGPDCLGQPLCLKAGPNIT